MCPPDQNTDLRKGAWERLARPATLGGLHAMRNALQVVRSYTLMEMPEGPGKDGTRSGLERMVEVTAALEGLLGQVDDQPAPEEVVQALRLLPEFFIYELRRPGLQLGVNATGMLARELLSWDLPLLVCRLLQELLSGCTPGMGGRVELELEQQVFTLTWIPAEGSLPFPLVEERPPRDALALAAGLGLDLQLLPEGYGFRAAPAPGTADRLESGDPGSI